MNDHDRALRDAFLAECWPVCREIPRAERAKVEAPPKQARSRSDRPRVGCPMCGRKFAESYLLDHLSRIHSAEVA